MTAAIYVTNIDGDLFTRAAVDVRIRCSESVAQLIFCLLGEEYVPRETSTEGGEA